MEPLFPAPIAALPEAVLPIPGCRAHLLQGGGQQVLFMRFDQDAELPEHQHAGQWGVVLEGRIDLVIAGTPHTFTKGDRYFIPAGVLHAAKIHAGYADITFFDQKDRYQVRP